MSNVAWGQAALEAHASTGSATGAHGRVIMLGRKLFSRGLTFLGAARQNAEPRVAGSEAIWSIG